ncbi:hypothetical protein AB0H92_49380 [Streptomyces phaeochromogenes]|uniref:hypothetical protein n=1 Tax=Streptomyces phaeochromogenes TaxID=1923 RepID=UPI003402A757
MGFDFDKDLYFVTKETQSIKKALTGISLTTTGLSHSMTGIKGDIDGLKAAVSLVAASAQVLKVDYSLWKIDEKGISFRGIQTTTWKNVLAEEEKKAEKKKKDLDKDLEEKQEDLKKHLKTMFLAIEKKQDIDRAWKRAGTAQTEADKANRGAALANRGLAQLRAQLRTAGAGAGLGTRQKGDYDKMRNSIQGLSQALAGI